MAKMSLIAAIYICDIKHLNKLNISETKALKYKEDIKGR